MSFLIGLLTVVLVLDCLLLILLVLIQLPKKEAGAGLAFGGSATDALFGAGSGNALTQITKYAAGVFFGLAVMLSMLNAHVRKQQSTLVLPQNWQTPAKPAATTPSTEPAPMPAVTPATVTNALLSIPTAATTNAPAAK